MLKLRTFLGRKRSFKRDLKAILFILIRSKRFVEFTRPFKETNRIYKLVIVDKFCLFIMKRKNNSDNNQLDETIKFPPLKKQKNKDTQKDSLEDNSSLRKLIIDDSWISASSTRNFMLKDPILDWLDMYGEKKGYEKFILK